MDELSDLDLGGQHCDERDVAAPLSPAHLG